MEADLNKVQQQVRAINTQLSSGLVNANTSKSTNKLKDGGCSFYVEGGQFVVQGNGGLRPIRIDPSSNGITDLKSINYRSIDDFASKLYVKEELNREFNLDKYRKKDDLSYVSYYVDLTLDETAPNWDKTHYCTPVTPNVTIKIMIQNAYNDTFT